ncbi:MAG: hypothetical protein Q8O48_12575, partial [Anaerolineales bacterium]|nr:hypothetical protein [Anaerolineales bacterium]
LLSSVEFNQRFKKSPVKRAQRRGYLRNLAVAIGNHGSEKDIPILELAMQDDEASVREHAKWAKEKIQGDNHFMKKEIVSERTPSQ